MIGIDVVIAEISGLTRQDLERWIEKRGSNRTSQPAATRSVRSTWRAPA